MSWRTALALILALIAAAGIAYTSATGNRFGLGCFIAGYCGSILILVSRIRRGAR